MQCQQAAAELQGGSATGTRLPRLHCRLPLQVQLWFQIEDPTLITGSSTYTATRLQQAPVKPQYRGVQSLELHGIQPVQGRLLSTQAQTPVQAHNQATPSPAASHAPALRSGCGSAPAADSSGAWPRRVPPPSGAPGSGRSVCRGAPDAAGAGRHRPEWVPPWLSSQAPAGRQVHCQLVRSRHAG